MASTTNYSWSTPDDTALVKDGAAAIRSLGSSIDTTTKALNPSTTLGDIEYRSATANTNTRLPIGTSGQVLSVVGGVPAWAAVAAGGKVLQVVESRVTTDFSTSSGSATDTGLSVTITPSSATSKILVLATHPRSETQNSASSQDNVSFINLLRNSTMLQQTTVGVSGMATSTGMFFYTPVTFTVLDSPNTTSAVTYKTQASTIIASLIKLFGSSTRINSIIAMEIGA